MIYTIGHRESYNQGFEEFKNNPHDFKKMGKKSNYIGGSVFKTYIDAETYLEVNGLHDFEVYGVLADWLFETEDNEHGQFNNLLVDAQLVSLS